MIYVFVGLCIEIGTHHHNGIYLDEKLKKYGENMYKTTYIVLIFIQLLI